MPGRMVVVLGRAASGSLGFPKVLLEKNWPKLWDKTQNGKPGFNAEVGRCCTSTVFCTLASFPDSMQQSSFAGNETNLT